MLVVVISKLQGETQDEWIGRDALREVDPGIAVGIDSEFVTLPSLPEPALDLASRAERSAGALLPNHVRTSSALGSVDRWTPVTALCFPRWTTPTRKGILL